MLSQRVFKQHRGIRQSSNTNNRMLVNIYRERLLDAAHRSSMTVTLSLEWYLANVRSRLFWNAKHLNLGHYSRGQSQKKNQQCTSKQIHMQWITLLHICHSRNISHSRTIHVFPHAGPTHTHARTRPLFQLYFNKWRTLPPHRHVTLSKLIKSFIMCAPNAIHLQIPGECTE